MQASSVSIKCLRYADDCALNATTTATVGKFLTLNTFLYLLTRILNFISEKLYKILLKNKILLHFKLMIILNQDEYY